MKITKQRLKEIIKEELGTLREQGPQIALHDLENQLVVLQQSVLTFLEPYDAGQAKDPKLAAALEDTLSVVNNTLEVVARAAGEASELDPADAKGPRFTSTGPWAPEYRDK